PTPLRRLEDPFGAGLASASRDQPLAGLLAHVDGTIPFRLRRPEAMVAAAPVASDLNQSRREVDILPAEPERLAWPHPGPRERQEVVGLTRPHASDGGEEAADLIRG